MREPDETDLEILELLMNDARRPSYHTRFEEGMTLEYAESTLES